MATQTDQGGSLRVGRVAAPLREEVTAVLREAILSSRWRPGERLVERELIEETGVSRATIREVLRQLTAEGLVTIVPQRGAVVVELTDRQAKDLYEVRSMIEAFAARLFAERASDDDVRALRQTLVGLQATFAETKDSDRRVASLIAAKDEYYSVLFEGTGNDQVRVIHDGIQARVRLMRAASLGNPDRPARTLAEIETVVEAIERRDPEAAEAAAREHVQRAAVYGLEGLSASRSAIRK